MAFGGRIQQWSRAARTEVNVLALAARDPRTPRLAKWVAAGSLAYAVSPIDLIPDFIPVLGQLDDLVLVPAGLWLARRLISGDLMSEFRAASDTDGKEPLQN